MKKSKPVARLFFVGNVFSAVELITLLGRNSLVLMPPLMTM
jgi:hypothetical protein